jgi:hypothetical protein
MIFSRRSYRVLKVLLFISAAFVFIKIIQNGDDDGVPQFGTEAPAVFNGSNGLFDQLYSQHASVLNLSSEPNFVSPIDPKTIVESLKFLNAYHKVLNVDKFGPISPDSVSVVIVVQVRESILESV